jgi:HTH-type transcriptional regulator / antitoxin HigA
MANTIKPIRTQADYKAAVDRLDELLDLDPLAKSALDDELQILTILVNAYEQVYFAIAIPDPIDAIKYLMDKNGLQQKDLEPYIGPKSRVSEILNRKRYFTLQQINNLHKFFNLPLEVFINDKSVE